MNGARLGDFLLVDLIRGQFQMFFVIIFLALAAFASYLFPEWSWLSVLMVSFGSVVVLRLALMSTGRKAPASAKDE